MGRRLLPSGRSVPPDPVARRRVGAPVGYLNDTKAHTVIVDESKAPLVRRLFESYATDRYSASGLRGLAKEWGLTSLNGKEIRPNRAVSRRPPVALPVPNRRPPRKPRLSARRCAR